MEITLWKILAKLLCLEHFSCNKLIERVKSDNISVNK